MVTELRGFLVDVGTPPGREGVIVGNPVGMKAGVVGGSCFKDWYESVRRRVGMGRRLCGDGWDGDKVLWGLVGMRT